jgi:hypothetical protein
MMRTLTALLLAACLLPAPVLAQTGTRPLRIVLIVDATEAIRQPIGIIRKALTAFVEGIDAQHEMMLVSVAGTPQIRVRPTIDRQQVVKSVNGIFGTSGSNVMNRVIDDLFHRFAQPADRRPVFRIQTFRGGQLTDLPVSLMIGRDTGGVYTNISPNGLLEVLERLASVFNQHNE